MWTIPSFMSMLNGSLGCIFGPSAICAMCACLLMYGHDTASETFQQLDKTRENFKLGLFMLWHSCIIEIERLQFFRKHCSPFYLSSIHLRSPKIKLSYAYVRTFCVFCKMKRIPRQIDAIISSSSSKEPLEA